LDWFLLLEKFEEAFLEEPFFKKGLAMDVLENYCEKVFDTVHCCGVSFTFALSRSVILIAKVDVGDPLVKLKNFIK